MDMGMMLKYRKLYMYFSIEQLRVSDYMKFLVAGLLFVYLFSSSSSSGAVNTKLIIKGSTTILPIALGIGTEFQNRYPGVEVQISGGGSIEGIKALIKGEADIAMSSAFISDQEIRLAQQHSVYPVPFRFAFDCIIPIVNRSNPLINLTRGELKDIFLGLIDNWKQLDGPDQAIQLVSRDSASGTYKIWKQIVMDQESIIAGISFKNSNAEVIRAVSQNPGAIGYISLSYLNSRVKPIQVDGVIGSIQSLKNGTYLLSRPLFMFTNGWPEGKTLEYINFLLDAEKGQESIDEAGYIPLNL